MAGVGGMRPGRTAPGGMPAYLPLPTRPMALGEVLRLWAEPNRDLSRLINPYLACLGHRLRTGHSLSFAVGMCLSTYVSLAAPEGASGRGS